jgi:hypothetical protein
VGNGWYRCTAYYATFSTYAIVAVASADNTTSYAGDGTSGLFIWGAQLEARSTATAYTPTTTQPITNYIPVLQTAASGVARFEHNPTTFESLGLLIEEQRTNLLLRSDDYANATWGKTNATIDSNTVVAPDGTLTGDKLVEDTTNGLHYAAQVATVANVSNSFSVYLKAAGRNFAAIECTGQFVYFDLVNGTVGLQTNATGSIQSVGNGWFRCTMISTPSAGARSFIVYPSTTAAAGGVSYAGDGYSGIFIWGAQLEAGAFPTSYIQTVASQVTRAADAASMTGANFSSWYNQAEGTLYADWGPCSGPAATGGSSIVVLTSTVGVNDIEIDAFSSAVRGFIVTNSVTQGLLSDTGVNGFNGAKGSLAYKINDFALSVNGRTALTDTSAVMPTVNQMLIGAYGSNPGILNGTIRKIAYYPIRCTNAQLQGLTS